MEIHDISKIVKDTVFIVFKSAIEGGGSVRGINAEGCADKLTRKEIDKLGEYAKSTGSKGMAWIRLTSQGLASSFGKFISEEKMQEIINAFSAKEGDVILIPSKMSYQPRESNGCSYYFVHFLATTLESAPP